MEDDNFENLFEDRSNSIDKNYEDITKELDNIFKMQLEKKEEFILRVRKLAD